MKKNRLADAADATLLSIAVIGVVAAAIVIAGLIAVVTFETLHHYTAEPEPEQMDTDE